MDSTALELLPVALALVAAVKCSRRYSARLPRWERAALALAVVCSFLLMFARSSWWSSTVLQGLTEGTPLASVVWIVFDALTMIIFILLGSQRKS